MDKTTQAVQQQIAAMGAQVFEADDADLARHKQELIQYMAWRSGERTMNAYEHVQRGRSFALRMQAIHREMEKRERHTITGTGSRRDCSGFRDESIDQPRTCLPTWR